MNITTTYFGDICFHKEDIIHFSNGIFGFESEKDFILIPFQGEDDFMFSLQSIHNEDLSFILMNPFLLKKDYSPNISRSDLIDLRAQLLEELVSYVICVVKDPFLESTINLKCPIVLNTAKNIAKQVILDTDDYDFRHPLIELTKRRD